MYPAGTLVTVMHNIPTTFYTVIEQLDRPRHGTVTEAPVALCVYASVSSGRTRTTDVSISADVRGARVLWP